MKIRVLALLALVVGLAVGLAVPAAADTEGTVTATVTPKVISITVAPSTVDYGLVDLGSTDNVPSPVSFTATNNGAVAEDFKIRGGDTSPGNWNLVDTAPGADEYRHNFSDDDITYKALTSVGQDLKGNVAVTVDVDVYLKLDAPTASTSTAEQSAAVTVIATEYTP